MSKSHLILRCTSSSPLITHTPSRSSRRRPASHCVSTPSSSCCTLCDVTFYFPNIRRLLSPSHRIQTRDQLHTEQRTGSWLLFPQQARPDVTPPPPPPRPNNNLKPFPFAATFRLELWGYMKSLKPVLYLVTEMGGGGGGGGGINEELVRERVLPPPPLVPHLSLKSRRTDTALFHRAVWTSLHQTHNSLFLTYWLFTCVWLVFVSPGNTCCKQFRLLTRFRSNCRLFPSVKPGLKWGETHKRSAHPIFWQRFLFPFVRRRWLTANTVKHNEARWYDKATWAQWNRP